MRVSQCGSAALRARARARLASASMSTSSVRSGLIPRQAMASRAATVSAPRPRPNPWYTSEESVNRSESTISPRPSAGAIHSSTFCAREAKYSSTSVTGLSSWLAASSRMRRIFMAMGGPPGSTVSITVRPIPRKRPARRCIWVVLPDPSMPSNVMKTPRVPMGTSIVGRLRARRRLGDNENTDSYKSSESNNTMTRLNVSKARDEFPELVNRAAYGGERTIVSRRGKDLAAVIPIEDLKLLEKLAREEMDRQDIEDAHAALAEPGESISIEDFIRELGD